MPQALAGLGSVVDGTDPLKATMVSGLVDNRSEPIW